MTPLDRQLDRAERAAPGEPMRWLRSMLDRAASTDECMPWPFHRRGKNGLDYGIVRYGQQQRRVTHVVLELTGRDRPSPQHQALHSCDNPPCCHPRHLRWGTNAENVRDRDERGRTRRGTEIGIAKLTPESVQEMRALSTQGWSTRRLASRFGVAHFTVRQVIHRRTWRHVPDRSDTAEVVR